MTISQFCDSAFVTPRGPVWWFTPILTAPCIITDQFPGVKCHACISDDAGSHEVPDPIAPCVRNGPPESVVIVIAPPIGAI